MGPNTPANNIPAVQVGVFISILSTTAETPVILRPLSHGYFSIVGPAFVPYIEEAPFFKDRIFKELNTI